MTRATITLRCQHCDGKLRHVPQLPTKQARTRRCMACLKVWEVTITPRRHLHDGVRYSITFKEVVG